MTKCRIDKCSSRYNGKVVPFLIEFRIMPTITHRVREQEMKVSRGNGMPPWKEEYY